MKRSSEWRWNLAWLLTAVTIFVGLVVWAPRPAVSVEVIPSAGRNLWCNAAVSTVSVPGGSNPYVGQRRSFSTGDALMRIAVACHYDLTGVTTPKVPSVISVTLKADNDPVYGQTITLQFSPNSVSTSKPGAFIARGDEVAPVNGSGIDRAVNLDPSFVNGGHASIAKVTVQWAGGGGASGVACDVGISSLLPSGGCPTAYATERPGIAVMHHGAWPLDAPPTPDYPAVWPTGLDLDHLEGDFDPPVVACRRRFLSGTTSVQGQWPQVEAVATVRNPVPGISDVGEWVFYNPRTGQQLDAGDGKAAVVQPLGQRPPGGWVLTFMVRRVVPYGGIPVPADANPFPGGITLGPANYGIVLPGVAAGVASNVPDEWVEEVVGPGGPEGVAADGTVYVGVDGATSVAVSAVSTCSVKVDPHHPADGATNDDNVPPTAEPVPPVIDWPDWPSGGGGGPEDPEAPNDGEDCEGVGGSIPGVGGWIEGATSFVCSLAGALGELLDGLMDLLGDLLWRLFVPQRPLAGRLESVMDSAQAGGFGDALEVVEAVTTGVMDALSAAENGGSCQGPEWSIKSYTVRPVDACDEPMESVATWLRNISSAVLVLGAALRAYSMIAGLFGAEQSE